MFVVLTTNCHDCRTWELAGAWAGKGIDNASLFVIGDQDLCYGMFEGYIKSPVIKQVNPNLKALVVLPGVGHFCAEEAPEQVNKHILKFLKEN
jgi:pimeloyl-ACP methyl ester carboxylesterase